MFSEILHLPSGEDKHFVIFVFELAAPSLEVGVSVEGEMNWFSIAEWEKLKEKMIPSDWMVVKQLAIDAKPQLELREVKMCEKLVGGKTCYELEAFEAP